MKLCLRHLKTSEADCELIFGILVIPLSLLLTWCVTKLPAAWVPYCIFRRVTNIPCPACGTFRSASLLSHGQFMNAWTTQPLMTTAIIFATLFVVYSWVFVLFRLPRLRLEGSTKGPALLLAVLLVVATAASWVYLLVQAR